MVVPQNHGVNTKMVEFRMIWGTPILGTSIYVWMRDNFTQHIPKPDR